MEPVVNGSLARRYPHCGAGIANAHICQCNWLGGTVPVDICNNGLLGGQEQGNLKDNRNRLLIFPELHTEFQITKY